ncbi:MAG TPA: 5-formyltetrahydrofolate cyclo-ligase [Roseiflexaceae bacterium]|nr:5-formyltetrahydrofolate cyclo-ligase [Roseiflexaceae bacterium]
MSYPIVLNNLRNLPVVMIGGGAVATRKLRGLLATGATVRLISPEITPELHDLAARGAIVWEARPYQTGDLNGARLVFAATNRREVNAAVAQEATALGLLCNIADDPAASSFHLPAVHRAPGVVVAVSTDGASPARAKRLRDRIAAWLAASDEDSMDKATLRREAMQRRDALDDRSQRSAAICERIIGSAEYRAARAIHCFLPMRSEVDVRPLIADALAQGKGVVVPVVVPKALELSHAWLESLEDAALTPGAFGTANPRSLRPAAPGDWDLTIVPLLTFDRRGHRLGYGKGFYDRLLATLHVPAIGVAFAAQEIDALPDEPHDVALDGIVTEREFVKV